MPKKRNTSKEITKRILKFADAAIKNGQLEDIKDLAKIADMSGQQLYNIRTQPDRYFTLDQLYNMGKHFNLDMNYFIYGQGTPFLDTEKKRPISAQLRDIITTLDVVPDGKGKR